MTKGNNRYSVASLLTALVNSYRRFIMPLVRGQTNYICPLTCTIIALRHSVAPCLARRNSHKAGRTRNKSKNPRKTYVLHGQTVCSVCGTTVLESPSAFPLIDRHHSLPCYVGRLRLKLLAYLSPQPSESHIVRYGACRHSTVADSLIVLYRFSSHQRFMCL